jgi:hypothetical protein
MTPRRRPGQTAAARCTPPCGQRSVCARLGQLREANPFLRRPAPQRHAFVPIACGVGGGGGAQRRRRPIGGHRVRRRSGAAARSSQSRRCSERSAPPRSRLRHARASALRRRSRRSAVRAVHRRRHSAPLLSPPRALYWPLGPSYERRSASATRGCAAHRHRSAAHSDARARPGGGHALIVYRSRTRRGSLGADPPTSGAGARGRARPSSSALRARARHRRHRKRASTRSARWRHCGARCSAARGAQEKTGGCEPASGQFVVRRPRQLRISASASARERPPCAAPPAAPATPRTWPTSPACRSAPPPARWHACRTAGPAAWPGRRRPSS